MLHPAGASYYPPSPASLRQRHSWLAYLPQKSQATFIRAYAKRLKHCEAKGDFQPMRVLLAQWEYTASIHADPALLAALLKPIIEDSVTGQRALMPPTN